MEQPAFATARASLSNEGVDQQRKTCNLSPHLTLPFRLPFTQPSLSHALPPPQARALLSHHFSMDRHTAFTFMVDSRGRGAMFTQMAVQLFFSGSTDVVPIDQSAPGLDADELKGNLRSVWEGVVVLRAPARARCVPCVRVLPQDTHCKAEHDWMTDPSGQVE